MPRARDEADAEPLEVVVGIAERVDLELAAVARAGIDMADRERAVKVLQHSCFEPLRRHAQRIVGRRRRLGLDADDGDLFK